MRGIPVIGHHGSPRTRRVVASAVTLAAAMSLAACGSSGPSTTSSAKGLTMWALNDQPILQESVDAYNKDHPDAKITLRVFANDDYKQKLRVAFGANQAPDLFFNWGGGALNDYVEAGKVGALTTSEVTTDRFTPSVMQSATFGNKVYGVPANGLAPVVLYYNKKVLADAGVEPPKTYDDLLAAVKKLKAKDVIPMSLAGNSKWPTLMYLEYLLDREGGSEVFSKIASGDASAWKDPSVTKANQYLQELSKAGAFGDSPSSVSYDQGASTALLYTGKAAMEVMGTWEYANIAKAAPDLLKNGDLGYTAFPTLPGGAGDPKSIVGNPSNFLSLNASTKHKAEALTYLKDYVLNDSQVDAYLAAGSVPPVKGLESKLAGSKSSDKAWLQFVYGLVQNAPSFQLSWDQALPSDQADPLLTNTDKSLLGQIPPAEFGTNMSKAGS